jgi:hypothetical protein
MSARNATPCLNPKYGSAITSIQRVIGNPASTGNNSGSVPNLSTTLSVGENPVVFAVTMWIGLVSVAAFCNGQYLDRVLTISW